MFELNYDALPGMSVQIGRLEGEGDKMKHGITIRTETQPLTLNGKDVQEFSFVINGEKEMERFIKSFSLIIYTHQQPNDQ